MAAPSVTALEIADLQHAFFGSHGIQLADTSARPLAMQIVSNLTTVLAAYGTEPNRFASYHDATTHGGGDGGPALEAPRAKFTAFERRRLSKRVADVLLDTIALCVACDVPLPDDAELFAPPMVHVPTSLPPLSMPPVGHTVASETTSPLGATVRSVSSDDPNAGSRLGGLWPPKLVQSAPGSQVDLKASLGDSKCSVDRLVGILDVHSASDLEDTGTEIPVSYPGVPRVPTPGSSQLSATSFINSHPNSSSGSGSQQRNIRLRNKLEEVAEAMGILNDNRPSPEELRSMNLRFVLPVLTLTGAEMFMDNDGVCDFWFEPLVPGGESIPVTAENWDEFYAQVMRKVQEARSPGPG